jgi:hypothetical protein
MATPAISDNDQTIALIGELYQEARSLEKPTATLEECRKYNEIIASLFSLYEQAKRDWLERNPSNCYGAYVISFRTADDSAEEESASSQVDAGSQYIHGQDSLPTSLLQRLTEWSQNPLPITELTIEPCQQLTKIPGEIGRLSSLTKLNIYGRGSLCALPNDIGALRNLRILRVQYCKLEGLPPTIGELGQLRILDLRQNHLTSLPNKIGKLKSLQELNISYNTPLTAESSTPFQLPPSIVHLPLQRIEAINIVPSAQTITLFYPARFPHMDICGFVVSQVEKSFREQGVDAQNLEKRAKAMRFAKIVHTTHNLWPFAGQPYPKARYCSRGFPISGPSSQSGEALPGAPGYASWALAGFAASWSPPPRGGEPGGAPPPYPLLFSRDGSVAWTTPPSGGAAARRAPPQLPSPNQEAGGSQQESNGARMSGSDRS